MPLPHHAWVLSSMVGAAITAWDGKQAARISRSTQWQVLAVISITTLRFVSVESAESAGVQRSGLGFPPCTQPCQLATCDALKNFFLSTYESCSDQEDTWRNRQGWEALLTKGCSQIVGESPAAGPPVYCGWHGVECCNVPGYCVANVVGLVMEVNGLCGNITDSRFMQSILGLHQLGLMKLILTGNSLTGSLADFWGQLVNLRLLVLAKNMITGTIPDAMRNLTKLQVLALDRNPMRGHLPEWLSELQSLELLGLSALSGINDCGRKGLVGTLPDSLQDMRQLSLLAMEYNSLNGSLPSNICHDKLTIISLTGNQISGNISHLLQCKNLEVLAIGSNLFSGTLPDDDSWDWGAMRWLDLSNNALQGTLPLAIYKLQQLAYLNLANNRLTGTIRGSMRQLSLMTLLLDHNQFSSIDKSLWYSPRLTVLNLAHNNISGTLSPDIRASFYMESLILNHNRFTGTIPSDLGSLMSLKKTILTDNLFSCAGDQPDSRCAAGHLLPCFLQLSSITVPRPDDSNMECPYVEGKPIQQQLLDCESQVNTHMDHDPVGSDYRLDWELDPSYYQYQGCRCLKGYVAVWSRNGTIMSCESAPERTTPKWVNGVGAGMSSGGFWVLVALGSLVWYKHRVQFRRKWQRERELMKDRGRGVPSGSAATIVVTDVEGYSELMRQNAPVTTKALGNHNAILRRAVNIHAGHVIEQEGDSWSVAFYRPVQAVAFCLQVQQSLQKSVWPAELGVSASMQDHDYTTASDTTNTAELTAEIRVIEPSLATASRICGPGSLFDHSEKATLPLDRCSCRGPWESEAGSNKQKIARTPSTNSKHLRRYAQGAVIQQQSTQQIEQRMWMETPVKSANSNASTLFTKYEGSMTSVKGTKSVIRGLKVRMGVASGWVPGDDDITKSALFELAQAVSGMANGGQVLLESNAAAAVCDLLIELGGVTHKGYSDKRLSEAYHAEVKRNTSKYLWWILDVVSRTLRVTARDREPLLLDMGQFSVPHLHSAIIAAAPAGNRSNRSTADQLAATDTGLCKEASTSSSHTGSMLSPWAKAAQSPGTAMTADLQLRSASSTFPEANLQLYSITPVTCQARCKVWNGSLRLKEGTRQIAKGYFDAPGANVADLQFENALMASRQTVLPSVTMVFAAVQGGRSLVRRHAKVATSVHQRLSRAMQTLLMSFPDGYLCRGYEAELKYMLAFREPSRAVEWCLCLQELLDRLMWPTDVTKYYRSTTTGSTADVHTSGDLQNSIGRRPTLKFGLAEGIPDYMAPDHQGHADYFGSSVNLAARILAAAAHAGQIVMSCDLAQSIFSSWSYEAEFGLQDGLPLTCKQHNQLSKVASSNSPTSEAPACIKLEPPVNLSSFQTAAEAGSAIDTTPAPSAASLKIDLTLDSRTIWEARNCSSQPASPRRSAITSSSQPASPRRTTGQVRWSGIDCSIGWQQEQCTAGSFDGNVLQGKLSKHLSPLQLHVHQSQSHDGTNGTSPRSQAFLNNTCRQHSSDRQTVDEVKGSSRHVVQVSAYHLGTYAFKGCGEMQMVCLASDARAVAAEICAITPPRGSKGVLVSPASGPVVGLQHCTVALPDMWRVTEDRLLLSPSPTL